MIDPTRASNQPGGFVGWGTPGQTFQLAEAYRAEGNVEDARRLYRRAQEAALKFDEDLSQKAVNAQARWESQIGVEFRDWGLPIPELRELPDLIRAVSQQRLDQLDGKSSSAR